MDYVKLEHEMVELGRHLSELPDWMAVTTLDGKFLRQFPTHLDGEHIATLTHSNMLQSRHMLHDLENGTFRYSITAGNKGLYVIVLLGETHLVGLNYQRIQSVDALIASLGQNLQPLLTSLGIG